MERILVINPGSTSSKIAVYDGEQQVFLENINHPVEEIGVYPTTYDQLQYRIDAIAVTLQKAGIAADSFDCVMGRGGGIARLATGGYEVNQALLDSAKDHPLFDHVSNIGAALAYHFAQMSSCKAYIYDAVSAETLLPVAKITGLDGMERTSLCHVLNARAMSIRYAKEQGKKYEDMNLIVAHMGGGITVSAHCHGRIIDNVRDDGGPMSPTRCGAVNTMDVVDLCYSGKYTYEQMAKKVRGDAGLTNLLGTHNAREVERRIEEGDAYAKLVYDAMGFQVAKYAAMMIGSFTEPVDAVILTGGIAHSKMLTGTIKEHLEHTVKVVVMPGENEMEALAFGGLRILRGEEAANPAYE